MSEQTWLAGLKEGDEVVVSHGGWNSVQKLARVSRATATQVVVGATRYQRKSGNEIGGGRFTSTRICQPTAEVRAEIEDAARRRAALSVIPDGFRAWNELPTDALEQIAAIIEAHRKPA